MNDKQDILALVPSESGNFRCLRFLKADPTSQATLFTLPCLNRSDNVIKIPKVNTLIKLQILYFSPA